LVVIEQFAHAVSFVQWVELLLGNLFELFDELDDLTVLVLARVIGVQFDLFQLFNDVNFVFASRAPYRIAYVVSGIVDNYGTGDNIMMMLFIM